MGAWRRHDPLHRRATTTTPASHAGCEIRESKRVDEGLHDNLQYTAQMMVVDPTTVRMRQRIAVGKFSINGVDLAPAEKTIALGKRLVDYQASLTAEAIRKARVR